MKFSFFKSLYQPLPIDDSDFEEEQQPSKETGKNQAEPAIEPPLPVSEPNDEAGDSPEEAFPSKLLEKIISLINYNLPESIRNCIDIERQKQQVYEQVKTPLNDYLEQSVQKVKNKVKSGEVALQELYQTQLREITEKLNKRISELEREREEVQKTQLSTERQKRTLSDRVHELEEKLSLLEADRNRIDETRRQINEQLRKATIRIEQMEAGAENYTLLQNQLNEAQQQLAVFAQQGEQYKMELVAAEEAQKTREAEWGQLQESQQQLLTALEQRVADYKKSEAGLKERQTELEQALIEASVEHEALIRHCATLEEQTKEQAEWSQKLADLTAENNALKDQQQRLSASYDSLRKKKEKLEEKLNNQAEQLRQSNEQLIALSAEKSNQEAAISTDAVSFEEDREESGIEDDDTLDWLIPTRLETPQEREARYELERRQKEEQELREREQQEREREMLRHRDTGQMSLW